MLIEKVRCITLTRSYAAVYPVDLNRELIRPLVIIRDTATLIAMFLAYIY